LKSEGYSEGTVGAVQTFFLTGVAGPWTAETRAALAPVDTVVQLARKMILAKIYPGVDVLTARSRLLDDHRVNAFHLDIADRARRAIAALRIADENRKIPPLIPSCWIGRESCRHFSRSRSSSQNPLPSGRVICEPCRCRARLCRNSQRPHDDLPVDAFYFTGSIEEIRGGGAPA